MKRYSEHLPSAQEALPAKLTPKAIRQLTYSRKAKKSVGNKIEVEINNGGILALNIPGLTLKKRTYLVSRNKK